MAAFANCFAPFAQTEHWPTTAQSMEHAARFVIGEAIRILWSATLGKIWNKNRKTL